MININSGREINTEKTNTKKVNTEKVSPKEIETCEAIVRFAKALGWDTTIEEVQHTMSRLADIPVTRIDTSEEDNKTDNSKAKEEENNRIWNEHIYKFGTIIEKAEETAKAETTANAEETTNTEEECPCYECDQDECEDCNKCTIITCDTCDCKVRTCCTPSKNDKNNEFFDKYVWEDDADKEYDEDKISINDKIADDINTYNSKAKSYGFLVDYKYKTNIKNKNDNGSAHIVARTYAVARDINNHYYNIYHDNNDNIIAVSTYRNKPVVGIAKCHPEDKYEVRTGMEVAMIKCNLKIAEKRLKNSMNSCRELENEYRALEKKLEYKEDIMKKDVESFKEAQLFRSNTLEN